MIERFLPVAGSLHAAALDRVLLSIHTHMAIQAFAWAAFFIFVLIRFRSSAHAGPRAEPRQQGPRPLIPALAIGLVIVGDAMVLSTSALPAWFARTTPPPRTPAPLEVRIAAEQFAWNIHYPGPDGLFGRTSQSLISAANPIGIDRTDPRARDDIGLLNILMLPLNQTVIVHLSSRDVIHAFTLNEMRVRQDATPGMPTTLWFTPILAGRWDIACSQLCGVGHYRMRGEYAVMHQAEWDRWLASEVALLR